MKTDFGGALQLLRDGVSVRRADWNGKGMSVRLVHPEDWEGAPRRPYLEMYDAQGMLMPWLASQTDVLADDWEAVV